MNLISLIIKSFRHYFPAHLSVAAGIAISTAIITGGLIVGDSVTYSLLETARFRTGEISHMVGAGDRLFTSELARKMSDLEGVTSTPAFRLEGIAVSEGGEKRLNRIQVWGLEKEFDRVAGVLPGLDSLDEGECIISENLATRLNLVAGDQFLLRIRKASQVPANAPFVSGRVQTVSARINIKHIAGKEEMGRLNMQVSQTAPYNVFLSLDWVNNILELEGKCNLVLLKTDNAGPAKLEQSIRENWTAKDANLDIKYLKEEKEWKISTKRVFIDPETSAHLKTVLPDAEPVLTYFANSVNAGSRSNPYSFVSTLAGEGLDKHEIIISDWLAEDLAIKAGDTILMNYYVIGPLRKLSEEGKQFIVKRIIPQPASIADRELAPFIPGLSDAGSCSEWEAGVPVNLESIRDKDEDYWNKYRGTPKAFISLEAAEELWQNRFGDYTSFRIPADLMPATLFSNVHLRPDLIQGEEEGKLQLEHALVADLDPSKLGFEVINTKDEAIHAAMNGVDFSQLFLGLSFFILVSGIILTVLLLNYNLKQRSSQTGTLSALGFSGRKIIRMVMMENSVVAITGTILGSVLAMLYIRLVFYGLNKVWFDIVRTSVLEIHILPGTILLGFAISLLAGLLTMFLATRKLLKRELTLVQKNAETDVGKRSNAILWVPAVLLSLISLGLVIYQFLRGPILDPGTFFLAGGLLLISLLLFSGIIMRIMSGRDSLHLSFLTLLSRNISYKRGGSMTIIILLALGTFLVISTGANRKDFSYLSDDKTSGTGGYQFFAESTVPILLDLNNKRNRNEEGLMEDFSVVQFRVNEGDDASCLNLNRISNPRIISTDPELISGRFSFIASSELLVQENPWNSLNLDLGDLVPAVADQTVIQWGLGKKVGDTLDYINESGESLKLLLIGGLAPSVFQGNVIISEQNFLKHFPSSSGTNVFLVEGDSGNTESVAEDLRATFRDHGWEMERTEVRLSEFNSVTNTYLSIFLVMGTFGLVLGTVGLAIMLVRSIRERRYEIALMAASGYSRKKIRILVTGEYNVLLVAGIIGGLLTAVLSTLPVYLSPDSEVSLSFIGGLSAIILLNGMVWIWFLSGYQLRRIKITDDLRNE